MNEKRNEALVKNSFILSFGSLIPKILAILILPILTTYLSKEEYGNYDLIISATSLIVPVITLQIQQAIFRYLLSSKDKEKQEEYISSAIVYIFFISVVSIPVTLLMGILLKLQMIVSIITCFLVAAESIYLLLGQALRGIGKNVNYTLGVIVYAAVNAVLLVILIYWLRMGLVGVILSVTFAYFASACMMYISVLKKCSIDLRKFRLSSLKELLAFSAPIVPSSISLWVVNLSDRFIIINYLGAAANGIYSVANRIPALYSTAYNIFNLSWTETAAQVADDEKNPEIYYSQLFRKLFYFLIGVMLAIIAVSPLFYKIFINDQYYDSYFQTALLYFGVFFNSLVMFYAGIYIALKKTKQVGYSSVAGAVINIIVNLMLIKKLGLYAASISTLVSYLVIAIYRAIDINHFLKIKYDIRQLLVGIIVMIISSVFFYMRCVTGYIVCTVLALVYNFIFNRYMITWFGKKMFSKLSKKRD